jgi:DNA helicase-2/ATP-dependent DNA helicase PcrA
VRYGPGQLARLLGLPEPTTEQAAVISAPLGPMAVIAGAGSGKSETMAARLVWLVANGMVRPDRVLGLTFTKKAAAEFAERVRSRLDRLRRANLGSASVGDAGAATDADELLGEPVIGTYHSYAGRLVGDNALREGLEPSMRLITPALSWQLAAGIVAAYDGPMDQIGWTPQTVTAAVLQLAGDLAEHLREPGEVAGVGHWLAERREALPGRVPAVVRKIVECQRAREQLLPMVAAYGAAKAAREVLDYGDQVALAARIAARHPEVGAAERGRYQVVLLDEYQDTSHAQLVLLRALFGGGHPVTAVGDPCQSIYGWRGASAGNLRRFTTDFPVLAGAGRAAGGRTRPAAVRLLSTSFRNAGRILDSAAVIQEELRAEAPDVPRLVAAPDRAARGEVVCALLESVADEAVWVAERIAALLALPPGTAPDGQPWPDGRKDAIRPSDIAVLCRKRSQFIALRSAIEERGIPVEVVGLGGLLTVPEVQDVVATLRVLDDAAASDALARILTGPRWRIGPRDLVALGRRARELTRGESGGAPPRASKAAETSSSGLGAPGGGADALTEAITDLTAETGSLVEALDDLGDPAAYSRVGQARLRALGNELRALRGHVARPLADLTAEVERALGLDIEVAARPGADPATARADLDAFIDVAATFSGDREEPTLGAFLSYLTAAQAEEFGLETGRVGDADTVKLATVHAAKGLQWAAVVVPGLSFGERAQVFPARPRVSTRWTDNARLIPFGLRGDAADLPRLRDLDGESLSEFTALCAARDLAEERRLAYVAATRAAFWLGCSGYWWGEGAGRLGPSPFLEEVRSACEAGAGQVALWAPPPAEDAENPALALVDSASWPTSPAGERYEAVREAAALVETAIRETVPAAPGGSATPGTPSTPGGASAEPTGAAAAGVAAGEAGASAADEAEVADVAMVTAWERDADLLLAERARRRGDGTTRVALPSHLSVSSLVALARDPDELARQVRRPMPRPPSPHARRGTAFHRWLEERYGQQRLIDDGDLFADEDADTDADARLAGLRAQFEASEWGDRWPLEVEVPFETLIGGRLVRGRIDAVFDDSASDGALFSVAAVGGAALDGTERGQFDVVDWKTGRPPSSESERHAVAVQLAAYRLAWAALAGVSVDQVRAAFHYVRHNQTVRPADLLDAAGLTALIEQVPVDD